MGVVLEVNADILGAIEGCAQVEVIYVKAQKVCAFAGEDTIDEEFEELQRGGWCANISRIADEVAADGDSCAVGVLLLWEDFTDDQGVCDLFTSVGRDFIVVDDKEGIRYLDALSCSLCIPSYPLA